MIQKIWRSWLTAAALVGLLALTSWAIVVGGQPFKHYQLQSELQHLSPQKIDEVVAPFLQQGFWHIELKKLHQALMALEWVESVKVSRGWPDQLKVQVVEQVPVVRWRDKGVLNSKGDIFYPAEPEKNVPHFAQFVQLVAEDVQARPLLQQFVALQTLLEPVAWQVERLEQLVDGVWYLKLANGMILVVDSSQWQEKLQTFIRVWPKLSQKLTKFAQFYDLRYSNGFVIERDLPELTSEPMPVKLMPSVISNPLEEKVN